MSIRLIAYGEILRRLISKCCVSSVAMQAMKHLCPIQVGVGVSNGPETIIHSFNRLIRDPQLCNDDTVIALLDFENAFNNIHRQNFLDEILRLFPSLYGWVQYTYGTGAKLFSGSDMIVASNGGQQGDPIAPLLFCLAAHPIFKTIRDQFNLISAADLDDFTIAGPSRNVADAIKWLESSGPPCGLFIDKKKTVIWSLSGQDLKPKFTYLEFTREAIESQANLLGTIIHSRVKMV